MIITQNYVIICITLWTLRQWWWSWWRDVERWGELLAPTPPPPSHLEKRSFCNFFLIISVRSSQCLCCRGVKQPWHETTDFPLLGKDQKPNVSQTLWLLTLKRYKLGELLHGPSFWSFERFLWDLEKADAKKPSKTDQGHCGGNLGEGILSQVSFHIVTFHTHFFVPTKTFLEIFNNKMT